MNEVHLDVTYMVRSQMSDILYLLFDLIYRPHSNH